MNKSSHALAAKRLKKKRWTLDSGAKIRTILQSLFSIFTKLRLLLNAHVPLVDAAEHKHCRTSGCEQTFYDLD